LEFFDRSRAPFLANHVGKAPLPEFPLPASRAEALGMLYVLEGSTLGGHLILRTLAALRVDVAGPGVPRSVRRGDRQRAGVAFWPCCRARPKTKPAARMTG
jgi:hypothetical protein